MKCALELITIKTIAEKKYEEEQRRLDAIAEKEYVQLKFKTIDFCETTLNDIFVEKAKNRKSLDYRLPYVLRKDRCGNKIIFGIMQDGMKYSTGEPSYMIDSTVKYAYDTLINYLEDHCFKVDTLKCWDYNHYGSGMLSNTTLRVYVPKE